MKLVTAITVMTIAVSAPVLADDDCRHSAPRNITVDSAGIDVVKITARAGSLRVRGRATGEIGVTGTACASDPDDLASIRLRSTRSGSTLTIEAEIPETDGGFFFDDDYASLDFEVDVPAGMAVEISDGSGSIEVEDVGRLAIRDGSGSIEVERIRGPVSITDGSGSISIDGASGEVRITDGSGSISIEEVRGVVIESDGSGSIDIRDVDGNVLIEQDGSGSIDVSRVSGWFTVERDGSGGVRSSDVSGRVTVPRD